MVLLLGWPVIWAVKEFTMRKNCRKFLFYFPKTGKALRGGGFKLLLDYNWIKKDGGGGGLLSCGPWAVGEGATGGLGCISCSFAPKLSFAWQLDVLLLSSDFQS